MQRLPQQERKPLAAGEVLGGCRIERLVGEGGWGHVYRAADLASGARVVIKHFRPLPDTHGSLVRALEAFVGAARLLHRLDHPALLRVERWWMGDDEAGYVSVWQDGQTLAAWREQQAQPPDEGWLRDGLLKPLLGAVQCLHEAGRLHGDIAPDNVVLRPDGRPLLLDFGAARRLLQPRDAAPDNVINPGYAPLEQHRPGRASAGPGPWTDLHALAALARFALIGRTPPSALVRQDDEAALVPLQRLPLMDTGGCSEKLLAEIDRAMALHPAERPASVDEWRQALRAGGGAGSPRVDALIRMAVGPQEAQAPGAVQGTPRAAAAGPAPRTPTVVPLHPGAAVPEAAVPRWAGGGRAGEAPPALQPAHRQEAAASLPSTATPTPNTEEEDDVPPPFIEEVRSGEPPLLSPALRRLLPRVAIGLVVAALMIGMGVYVYLQRQEADAIDSVSRLLPKQDASAGVMPGAACGTLQGEELRRCLREVCDTEGAPSTHPLCERARGTPGTDATGPAPAAPAPAPATPPSQVP